MAELETEKLEAQKRFEALPENLKKEMLADKNVQMIISTCQDYKISEEDTKKVALLAGEVFLGYIKPEQVASELNKYFGVELQKSNFIEIELKQKIFNGLKADLDKVYNPLSTEALAKEDSTKEEVSPAVINLESVIATPLSGGSNPPLSPFLKGDKRGFAPIMTGKEISSSAMEEAAPFIIQTKVEAVKPATPQFSKESPSLNLKVDPSIIQKNPIVKPISVHLETTEPAQGKRFQMPVIAGQKIFSSAPAAQSLRGVAEAPLSGAASQTPRNDEKVSPTILQATQPFGQAQDKPKIEIKPNGLPMSQILSPSSDIGSLNILTKKPTEIQNPPQPSFKKEGERNPASRNDTKTNISVSPSLKEISEQKTASPLVERKPFSAAPSSASLSEATAGKQDKPAMPEPARSARTSAELSRMPSGQAKVVHYSAFKTDLNNLGTPKKPEPTLRQGSGQGKDDFINLNTFTKVSGNTVDLRSKSTNNE